MKKTQRRHDAAVKHVRESAAAVTRTSESTLPAWLVTSDPAAPNSEQHTVEQLHRSCPLPGASCQQRCAECRVCVHMMQCGCHDWVGQKVICKHIHIVCFLDGDLASQLLARMRDVEDPEELQPPPASPPPLLMLSVRHPVKNTTTQYLVQKGTELVIALPSVRIRQQIADHFHQIEQLMAISTQRQCLQQPLPTTSEDQRAWNARLERQPVFRPSRPARRPAAATVTSADVRSGRDTVAALTIGDVGREHRIPGAPDHTYF